MFRLGVLTVSTSGSQGQREDTSGEAIKETLAPPDYQVVKYEIVKDDRDLIADRLKDWSDSGEVDLIVTTGGTGMGRYDVTPEACLSILDKEVPGLAEAMRAIDTETGGDPILMDHPDLVSQRKREGYLTRPRGTP